MNERKRCEYCDKQRHLDRMVSEDGRMCDICYEECADEYGKKCAEVTGLIAERDELRLDKVRLERALTYAKNQLTDDSQPEMSTAALREIERLERGE